MADKSILLDEFHKVFYEKVGDMFSADVDFAENLDVGDGFNEIEPRYLRKSIAVIRAGINDVDLNKPEDLFSVVQAFYHELRHLEHHAEAYRGNGFSDDMEYFTIEYLASANDPIRYKRMYEYTAFETDANISAVKGAISLCSDLMPEVDFNQIAVEHWKARSKIESVPFVENWGLCTTVSDIVGGMKKHLEVCKQAKPMRPQTGVDFFGQVRTDGSLTYLQNYASKQFCELWKNAETNQERNYLSAMIYAEDNPRVAKMICPGISRHDICFHNVNVSKFVHKSSKLVTNNAERDFWSEHDMIGDLRTRLASGQLEIRSVGRGFEDRLNLNEYGLSIQHVSPDYSGERFEMLLFDENEHAALERVLDGFSKGSLYVARGQLSDVMKECIERGNIFVCDEYRERAATDKLIESQFDKDDFSYQ